MACTPSAAVCEDRPRERPPKTHAAERNYSGQGRAKDRCDVSSRPSRGARLARLAAPRRSGVPAIPNENDRLPPAIGGWSVFPTFPTFGRRKRRIALSAQVAMMPFDTVFTEVFGVSATDLSEWAEPPFSFSHGGGHRFESCVAHFPKSCRSQKLHPADGSAVRLSKSRKKGEFTPGVA